MNNSDKYDKYESTQYNENNVYLKGFLIVIIILKVRYLKKLYLI